MHTEGNDPGRPEGTSPLPSTKRSDDQPGYETQDVNVGGIVTFLAGLAGFVIVFFFFCFAMGKLINYGLAKQDGPRDKWHTDMGSIGETPRGDKREDLASDAEMQQKQLNQMTQVFPSPRLQTDDGNQDLADLHSREDLLLENYSTSSDTPPGTIRIPIERAMQLIVQRGLPQPAAATATAGKPAPATAGKPATLMAGETAPSVHAPLTDGFARTGYELKVMEARAERNDFNRAEGHQ